MHELGLVNYVVKTVTRVAEENHINKIKSVTLQFGEVSGIVSSYLFSYWMWYRKKYPLLQEAELKCEEIPAVSWCDDCKINYSTVAYGKKCPKCGGESTWLVKGNEMMIKEIEGGNDDQPRNA